MSPASYQSISGYNGMSLRRHPAAFLLAVAVHVLLVLMFFRLAPVLPPAERLGGQPLTVRLLPEQRAAAKRARAAAKTKSAGRETVRPAAARPIPPPVPSKPKPLPRVPSPPPIDFIPLTGAELAATDMALRPAAGEPSSMNGGREGQDDSLHAAGEGPGGARLYNAEWHRKPTNAELSFYLPSGNRKTGWGMIACQAIEGYRVDNCRELGQSPAGSGLSRAVRQAAWQFRVRPPRIEGRPIIGAWIRIRIEFTADGAELR